jgi:hypothetical protein
MGSAAANSSHMLLSQEKIRVSMVKSWRLFLQGGPAPSGQGALSCRLESWQKDHCLLTRRIPTTSWRESSLPRGKWKVFSDVTVSKHHHLTQRWDMIYDDTNPKA